MARIFQGNGSAAREISLESRDAGSFERGGQRLKRTILIVDDEIHLTRILEFTLRHAGYDTITAHDGREALEKALSRTPDLVILDLTLPVLDGAIVCREIKRAADSRGVRVIILTAQDIARREADESIGADLWMEKPFKFEALLEAIDGLLGGAATGAE